MPRLGDGINKMPEKVLALPEVMAQAAVKELESAARPAARE